MTPARLTLAAILGASLLALASLSPGSEQADAQPAEEGEARAPRGEGEGSAQAPRGAEDRGVEGGSERRGRATGAEVDDAPATRRAARVLEVLAGVRENLRENEYPHRTLVRERRGIYRWDCSGMADWVVSRVSRRARRALYAERPVARTFYRIIERAPTEGHRRGWQEVTSIADVRPGDVFAWLRSPLLPPRNTGHVGFVLETPRRSPRLDNAWLVRIADSTSLPHAADSRMPDTGGGYGEGTILFVTEEGDPSTVIGYGWFGDQQSRYLPTRVRFGRIH